MAEVVIYTKTYCPYSKECKEFLESKNVEYHEKIIDESPALEKEMEEKSLRRTDTPQIFINGHHIGSFDDLKALEKSDKLKEMLDL
ncbi:glutaredoxin 3 [Candidatus Peregrinibacteria bacterium]|nr:glutaredoxin 3 [Candidatus Peregrinibacteria bacterium]